MYNNLCALGFVVRIIVICSSNRHWEYIHYYKMPFRVFSQNIYLQSCTENKLYVSVSTYLVHSN